jgi:putative Ig domain-containing protein
MKRPKLTLVAMGFCLAGLLSGCGSSSPPPPPIEITTQSPLPSGRVNTLYSDSLNATGGVPPYVWNVVSGTVPPGLSLSATGMLSGTPSTAGSFNFSAAVTDAAHPAGMSNVALSITIADPLQITTTSLPNGSPGVFYTVALGATGGFMPYSWAITQGTLPTGLTLNAASGLISGTPTSPGTSSLTVQVSDGGSPVATATANLSIVINQPPPMNAALYIDDEGGNPNWNQTGLQIQSNGSLTLLPSSPESAITGTLLVSSPKLPLVFFLELSGTPYLKSLLVNSDYSLSSYSSAPLQTSSQQSYARPAVDPTGSNLYLSGSIDNSGTQGVTIYPGNGSLQSLASLAIANVSSVGALSFTPDGAFAFVSTCSPSKEGNILSYARNPDGLLTLVATYHPSSCVGVPSTPVSPDGKYLATKEVQIYSIASDGSLSPVLPQPFTVTLNGQAVSISDMTWDQSSSFLLVSTVAALPLEGGVAVLSFSGSTLTETVYPTGGAAGRIQRIGSWVYAMGVCNAGLGCNVDPSGILGFNFQNGQLIPLPGSRYQYGNSSDMVIY